MRLYAAVCLVRSLDSTPSHPPPPPGDLWLWLDSLPFLVGLNSWSLCDVVTGFLVLWQQWQYRRAVSLVNIGALFLFRS